MSIQDQQLQQSFELMRQGDRDGLALLYAISSDHMYGVVNAVLPASPDAIAVIKSVYVKIWQDRTEPNAYSGWTITDLTVLARRMAIEAGYGQRLATRNMPVNTGANTQTERGEG